MTDLRRALPSIDRLLAHEAFLPLLAASPRELVLRVVRAVQEELRAELAENGPAGVAGGGSSGRAVLGGIPAHDGRWYAARAAERLAALERPSLRPVINATGVVLHTNLGRAPQAAAARAAVERVAASFSNLEYDLEAGARGSRYDHCAALLSELTGAESALVVNNNAAALVLALNTLAEGRAAVVSRGELVEIGGAFRIPEIMRKSGARLLEVGATNKTHLSDYAAALEGTAALEGVAAGAAGEVGAVLKVHRSNFRIVGFSAEVPLAELVALAHTWPVPVINDLGSGLLHDLTDLGLPHEPTAGEALRAGADLVTMSGDKLLGGPQAGIILGRAELIARLRANPLCRAFRVDKLTLAALEATLALYRDPARARREIPVLRMLSLTAAEVAARAAALATRLAGSGTQAEVVAGRSLVGGGAYPEVELPTALLALEVPGLSGALLERELRLGDPAVAARVVDGRVVVDLRTVLEEEEESLLHCIEAARASLARASQG
jgi:L-seryl-tRNA(Ser) seleniumtransferase